MKTIFSEILENITPTADEIVLIKKVVNQLRNLIGKRAKELEIDYTSIEPQGSTGIKQTQLRDDYDIDLFIGIDYTSYKEKYGNLKKQKIKKKIKEDFLWYCKNWIMKSLTTPEFQQPRLLYAEHPYVQVNYKENDTEIQIDIVLYFDLNLDYIIENGPITAVDRSPWHGKFVREKLTKEQKDDVRLLKQFFKACHSYGDKSAVGRVGFIGYSAELLIFHYDTILNVFKNFNALKNTPLDYYGRSKKKLDKIKHFQNDCLIIVDPIDKNRNVGSAISEKAYKYCNSKISEFLSTPSKDYFEIDSIPEFKPEESQEIAEKLFILETKNVEEEIHYTETRDKLYSLGDFIVSHGKKEYSHEKRFGNILFEVYFEVSLKEYILVFYCEDPVIPSTYERRGPPLKSKKHVKKFKEKNQTYFEKDGFLWTETKREYHKFNDFIEKVISKRIPKNLEIINISNSNHVKTISGRKGLFVLKNMVIPFFLE